jgi:hypothetical protein
MSAPLLNQATARCEVEAQQTGTKVNYAPVPSGEYKIDPAHSVIGFAIRHYEISLVRGRFKDFTGTIRYDESNVPNSSVDSLRRSRALIPASTLVMLTCAQQTSLMRLNIPR